MPLVPDQIVNNRYRIVGLLGHGGFGAVYQAWDNNLSRACAVKENLNTQPEAQRQFMREATVLANLSHPNLPRVTDYFVIEGQGQYLVMDFVEGEDLASIVGRQGAVPASQAVLWITQVLEALIYLHSRQPPVVHRDIKPANIRITPEGRAVLVDFGLVKIYDPGMHTSLGARAVTPGYAPPEQYGRGSTDPRTDIYALGATFYNLLTGVDPMDSIRRMVGGKFLPASQVNSQVPEAISQVVERAMAIEAAERFQTAAEFKEALVRAAAPAPMRPAVQETPAVAATMRMESAAEAPRPVEVDRAWPAATPAPAAAPPRPAPFPAASVHPTPAVARGAAGQNRTALLAGGGLLVLLCLVGTVIVGGWLMRQPGLSLIATSTPTATLPGEQQLLFGPYNGSLAHNPANRTIEGFGTGVNVKNFIVEVQFINPYSPAEGSWDYGLVFRHEGENRHFRLLFLSDGSYVLLNHVGSNEGQIIQQGILARLELAGGGMNKIRLVCQDEKGWLYLNDVFVADLQLGARLNAGNIFVVTGVYEGDEMVGKVTAFQGLTIWPAP